MVALSDLGFGPFFETQLVHTDGTPARIAAEHRGGYEVWSEAGVGVARLAGRLVQPLEGVAFPGVGDWVVLRSPPSPDRIAVIDRVLTRRTGFVRGAAGREARGQVVAANVDVVFVVCGLDADYNLRRIERYLARAWASGAVPVVILNKADLCLEPDERAREVARSCPGAPVITASALCSDGIDALREYLGRGTTAALVGSSGAGKSTLTNALLGEARMATGQVRPRDGRGCHTTTHRQLFLLPERQGLLIDTPGMRALQLLDAEGLDAVFTDIEAVAQRCRYRDCRHQSEPGCAVREAMASGALQPDRVAHFQKIGREAQAFELRCDEQRRRKNDRAVGKQRAKDAKLLRRWKER